jgi:hypothetical protein
MVLCFSSDTAALLVFCCPGLRHFPAGVVVLRDFEQCWIALDCERSAAILSGMTATLMRSWGGRKRASILKKYFNGGKDARAAGGFC